MTIDGRTDVPYSGLACGTWIAAGFLRFARAKCSNCHKRRVLYEVRMQTSDVILAQSARVCSVCANLR